MQLSSVYYAEGDTNRAKTIAADAVTAAEKGNIRTLATNGLIDLGYTLLARGEFAETRSYLSAGPGFRTTGQVDSIGRAGPPRPWQPGYPGGHVR